MIINKPSSWNEKVQLFCDKYNIPIEYLAEIMLDLKVIPMIRGKAFEYSALIMFLSILNDQYRANNFDFVLTSIGIVILFLIIQSLNFIQSHISLVNLGMR